MLFVWSPGAHWHRRTHLRNRSAPAHAPPMAGSVLFFLLWAIGGDSSGESHAIGVLRPAALSAAVQCTPLAAWSMLQVGCIVSCLRNRAKGGGCNSTLVQYVVRHATQNNDAVVQHRHTGTGIPIGPCTPISAFTPTGLGVTPSPQPLLRGHRHVGPMGCTMSFPRISFSTYHLTPERKNKHREMTLWWSTPHSAR